MSPSARVKHENIYNVGHLISGISSVKAVRLDYDLLCEYLNNILCHMLAGFWKNRLQWDGSFEHPKPMFQ